MTSAICEGSRCTPAASSAVGTTLSSVRGLPRAPPSVPAVSTMPRSSRRRVMSETAWRERPLRRITSDWELPSGSLRIASSTTSSLRAPMSTIEEPRMTVPPPSLPLVQQCE